VIASLPGSICAPIPSAGDEMEREHDTMMTPPIEELLDRVDSKFGLVTLAARRARNINAYFNQLGEGLGHMVPPQVATAARKPLSIGFQEIAADKIRWAEPRVEEPADEAETADAGGANGDGAEDVETES
jgi:DNA-directed RNA polymerase subunit omega